MHMTMGKSQQALALLTFLSVFVLVPLPQCLSWTTQNGQISFGPEIGLKLVHIQPLRTSLELRGGSREMRGMQNPKKKAHTEQARTLAKRKQSWKTRFGESNSDDISNDDVSDPDRPDYYKRPLPPTPQDDFSRSGLPTWLDPIYDDVEPEEDLKAEMQDADDDTNALGWEEDIDSSDLLQEVVDPETGEPTVALKTLPGDDWFSDKEFTVSEIHELERIWNWNERNFGKQAPPSESEGEDDIAALPWESATGRDATKVDSGAQLLLPLEGTGETFGVSDADRRDPPDPSEAGGESEGAGAALREEEARRAEVRQAAAEEGGLNYTAMVESAGIYADGAEVERAEGALHPAEMGPPPQYEGDRWPFEAGVCEEGRHPLEYQVSEERLRFWGGNWLRAPLDRLLRNFSVPDDELQRQSAIRAAWGFCPAPGDAVEGFNTWPSTQPPPPNPPLAPRPGDVVVPDDCASVPAAVAACADGGRVWVRGGTNQTWVGPGTRTRRGALVDRYDRKAMETARPEGEQVALLRALQVPAGRGGEGVQGEGEGGRGWCMHLAAEEGARIGGRWLLRRESVGSMVGAECVWEVNMSQAELPLQGLMSTVEVRGGPWLLQQCGVRACGGVAVDCTRRGLLKLRQCGVGGLSERRGEHAAGGRAVMGVQARDWGRCVLRESTVEQTGWFWLPGVRAAGAGQVALQGCVLQRNLFAVALEDRGSVELGNCSVRQNAQAAFFARERAGEVTGAQADEEETREQQERLWAQVVEEEAGGGQGLYPIPKLARRTVRWDGREWGVGSAAPSVRVDPLLGNVTDGWAHAASGWTHGVPEGVRAEAEAAAAAAGVPAGMLPESLRRWGAGQAGCGVSRMVADGELPGESLAVGFNAGAHEARLVVADTVVAGDVWATRGRPGTLAMRNVTKVKDAWVEKFLGSAGQRPTVRQALEAVGLRWDRRRRTYLKPVRMRNGTVVEVRWNETRFAREAEGGYPGGPEDYPRFDPDTKAPLPGGGGEGQRRRRRYELLGYEERGEGEEGWERLRRKAALRQARAEARSRRGEGGEGGGGEGAGALEGEAAGRERAVLRLAERWYLRRTREDPALHAAVHPPHLLLRQP